MCRLAVYGFWWLALYARIQTLLINKSLPSPIGHPNFAFNTFTWKEASAAFFLQASRHQHGPDPVERTHQARAQRLAPSSKSLNKDPGLQCPRLTPGGSVCRFGGANAFSLAGGPLLPAQGRACESGKGTERGVATAARSGASRSSVTQSVLEKPCSQHAHELSHCLQGERLLVPGVLFAVRPPESAGGGRGI